MDNSACRSATKTRKKEKSDGDCHIH
jgi:hypothetical protein